MLRLSILRALIRESLLLEDRVQDLIDTDETGNLWSAREMGVTQIAGLTWLKSLIDKGIVGDRGEPLADVVPVIKSFFKQGMSDRLNRAGLPTDIVKYPNPSELRRSIESLGTSKGEQKKAVKQSETDVIYESDNFVVVMPRSTASACFYGKGTTWCTAATEGTNLFLTYVGSGRGIILYHIMKKGGDSRVDPTSKINLATIKGQPYFTSVHGSLSVDASNNGLTQEKYNAILGDEAQAVLDKIVAHSASLGNKHPAAKEVDASVANLAAWKAKTDKMPAEVYNDYITFAFKGRTPDRDILAAAELDPRTTGSSKYEIFANPNYDSASLVKTIQQSKDVSDPGTYAAIVGLASKPNASYEELKSAIESVQKMKGGNTYAARFYQNPAIPAEVLIEKYREQGPASMSALDYIALNPNLPDDFIMEVFKEALDPKYTPTTLKAQEFMVDVARSRKGDIDYETLVWDAVKDPKSAGAFQSSQFYSNVAKAIAMHSENPSLLEDVTESAMRGRLARIGYEDARVRILLNIIQNSTTPKSLIQRIINEESSTLVVMNAEAILTDPANYDEDDIKEEHKNKYPEEYYDDEGDERGYDDDDY